LRARMSVSSCDRRPRTSDEEICHGRTAMEADRMARREGGDGCLGARRALRRGGPRGQLPRGPGCRDWDGLPVRGRQVGGNVEFNPDTWRWNMTPNRVRRIRRMALIL